MKGVFFFKALYMKKSKNIVKWSRTKKKNRKKIL